MSKLPTEEMIGAPVKAAWYSENGAARNVLVVGDAPMPSPGAGEVVVRMRTSGVNPSDVKSRQRRPLEYDRIIPHSDGAGVVEAVGADVPVERIGQRVWIWNGQWQRSHGTACEYLSISQSQAVELPESISFEAAACLGIPALTAIQAIRLAGPLLGKKLLVTGAGNAVGHYVTQLAVQRGATVIATAGSEARKVHALDAGASHVIDYKVEPVSQRVKELTSGAGVDLVIDMDFSSTADLIGKGALKAHGSIISYGSNNPGPIAVDFRAMLWTSLGIKAFLIYDLLPDDRAAVLGEMTSLLRSNALRHAIGPTFALNDIVAAHQAVENPLQVGNVILSI